MFAAALKEAMMHHALAKQNKDDRQDDYKQEVSNSERGRLSSGRGRRIRRSCHQSCVSTRSKLSIFIMYCQESGVCTILNTSESLSRQTSRRISRHVAMGCVQWELAAKVRIRAPVQLFPDNAGSNRSTARLPISCAEYHRHRQHICRTCRQQFAGVPLRSFGPGAYAG